MPCSYTKPKMMYMQFGSDGFDATMSTCTGLKRRRNIEWLGFKNQKLNRNSLSCLFYQYSIRQQRVLKSRVALGETFSHCVGWRGEFSP